MKVVIIGCGNVGMSYAYSLVNQASRVDDLVLIDINKEKAQGEAEDLNHALPYSPTKMQIRAGDYNDCNDAKIICICAGQNQEVGETRLDLINKNFIVFKSIIQNVKRTNFNGVYIIATNPVDVMSYVTYKLTGNAKKVIGSGTTLDTSRLKYMLGTKLKINPKSVHAYVVGEHGDSEMIPWSKASIGMKSINEYITKQEKIDLANKVKTSAYEIIKKKGNTSFGIGVCLLTITNSILDNDNSILTLSTYNPKFDVFISSPIIVGQQGVRQVFDMDLTEEEDILYENSAKTIKKAIETLKFDN